MNKKESVKKNFIYNLVFQVLIYLVPLVTTPYVSRVLGADNIGRYSYAMSIVTYFTMIAVLGTATYGGRAIAYNRSDPEKLSESFWNIFSFRLITTIISIALYFIYLMIFDYPIDTLEVIVVLNIINVAIDINWLFTGLEKFKQTVLRGLAVKLGGLVGIFIFVRSVDDTWKYGVILLGATILGNFSLWRYLPKLVKKPTKIRPFTEIKDIILVFLPTIATQIYMVLDKSMIGWIAKSNYENGCYEQSEKIVRVILIIITSAATVILPRVASLYSEKKIEEAKEYIYKGYRLVLFFAIPLTFGLIVTSSLFMPIYLGPGYQMANELLVIFSGILIPVGLASITGLAYLVPTKQQNVYTLSVTVAAVANFGLNMCLIRNIGAYGAALASVAAETIGTVIQIWYCVAKKQLSLKRIFLPSYKYFVSGLLMFAATLVIKKTVSPSFWGLMEIVIAGGFIYFILLLLLKDDLLLSIIKKITCKLPIAKK